MKKLSENMLKYETQGPDSFSDAELIEFFQQLIDSGLNIKKRKGIYSEIANKLISEKKITAEPRPQCIQFIMDLFD